MVVVLNLITHVMHALISCTIFSKNFWSQATLHNAQSSLLNKLPRAQVNILGPKNKDHVNYMYDGETTRPKPQGMSI